MLAVLFGALFLFSAAPAQAQITANLSLSRTSVPEDSTVTLTATLSEAAPPGGANVYFRVLNPGLPLAYTLSPPGGSQDITAAIPIAEGQTTATATVTFPEDSYDTGDVEFKVFADVFFLGTIQRDERGFIRNGVRVHSERRVGAYSAPSAEATLTLVDNDTAGVTISPATSDTNRLRVPEFGTNTYTVVLDAKPTVDVMVRPTYSSDAIIVSPLYYTFNPNDTWNQPVTFTVHGVHDPVPGTAGEEKKFTIGHTVAEFGQRIANSPYANISAGTVSGKWKRNWCGDNGGRAPRNRRDNNRLVLLDCRGDGGPQSGGGTSGQVQGVGGTSGQVQGSGSEQNRPPGREERPSEQTPTSEHPPNTDGTGTGGGGGGVAPPGGTSSPDYGGSPPAGSSDSTPDSPRCGESDGEYLESFYGATEGDAWDRNEHWNSQEPMDEWFGVGTDEDGEVVSLRLADNGLSGDMPTEELLCLNKNTELKELALWDNEDLSGDVPKGLELAVERAALRAIAEILDLNPEWFEDYEDEDPFDFEDWHEGVTTDDEGRVTELDLPGEISESIISQFKKRRITITTSEGGCALSPEGSSAFGLFLLTLVVFAVLVRKRAR